MHEIDVCKIHSHVLNKSSSTPVSLSFLSFIIKAIFKANSGKMNEVGTYIAAI